MITVTYWNSNLKRNNIFILFYLYHSDNFDVFIFLKHISKANQILFHFLHSEYKKNFSAKKWLKVNSLEPAQELNEKMFFPKYSIRRKILKFRKIVKNQKLKTSILNSNPNSRSKPLSFILSSFSFNKNKIIKTEFQMSSNVTNVTTSVL